MDIVLVSALGWAIAQLIKTILRSIYNRKVAWHAFFESGGFPSAHSAFVTCLTLQIGKIEGFRSSIFALAFGFWVVVVYDSFNVRYAVGIHSRELNHINYELAEERGSEFRPIKEVLGHTPFQVVCGVLLGALIAGLRLWFFPLQELPFHFPFRLPFRALQATLSGTFFI
uniref:divergent PAP2 family protein n=1 Tax=Ndongobacter massiliensis TaxID=1871025 RepID=UPI0009302773|nr:divergent PAP2 family protein [Ndongobacter massiliensis]